jgi:hypothetical protein
MDASGANSGTGVTVANRMRGNYCSVWQEILELRIIANTLTGADYSSEVGQSLRVQSTWA